MKNQKAFTLIELLVTVAIIGILSGIIFTVLNAARDKAKNASFFSSARSVNSAANVCCVGDGLIIEKIESEDTGIYVCSDIDIIDAQYPGDANINTVIVNNQCDDGLFEIVVTPGTKNQGSCESVTYNETGQIDSVGC